MGYFGGMAGPWMFLPALFWILVLGGIAFLIYALVRRQPAGSGPAPNDPLRDLSGRYARGEIDREQYLRMRDDLDGRGR